MMSLAPLVHTDTPIYVTIDLLLYLDHEKGEK